MDGKGSVSYGQFKESQIGGYIPSQFKAQYAFGSGASATSVHDFAISSTGLTGTQMSGAISSGYTSDAQQTQYAAMLKSGQVPPILPNSIADRAVQDAVKNNVNLSPEQMAAAVANGYTTVDQMKTYSAITGGGATAPALPNSATALALQNFAGSSSALTPQQMSDAVNRGYTSKDQMTLYGNMVKNGQTPPAMPNSLQAKKDEDTAKVTQAKQGAVDGMQDKINLIKELTTEGSGLSGSVGPNPIARLHVPLLGDAAHQAFLAKMDRLISTDALNALIAAKSQGATFGALSDKELDILKNAASTFNGLALYEDKKNPNRITGFRGSEENFRAELKRVQDAAQKVVDSANTPSDGGTTSASSGVESYIYTNPFAADQAAQIQQAKDEGWKVTSNGDGTITISR